MEPVVIAGVAFYLDHESKQAFPIKPQRQDDILWPREKSPRQSMNIDKQSKYSDKLSLTGKKTSKLSNPMLSEISNTESH